MSTFPTKANISREPFPCRLSTRLIDQLFINGIDRIYRRGKRGIQLEIISASGYPESIFKEEDIEDASFSTELDLKSADEFMEYEADRAENSRQMAARSIAFYRAMGRKIENSKLWGGVQ